MRLSRIEMKGFKSFANETHVHIADDVVGIVGPNGSGKSNIVDAIRWALGELGSKELRLSSMSDVIFNGTKDRRAASSAKVTLVFENTKNVLPTEYQNVAITRILYKDGKSEYRINDVKCRLKDINTLLADSGVGSNSYAIIALGMVEDILSDKNDSRRQMFEQAAGISKYKGRKKQTLQKLASTQEDIERLDDLLFEVENNLAELKKQASRTRRYKKLQEDYKTMFFSLARWRWNNFDSSYRQVQEEKTKQNTLLNDCMAGLRLKEAEIESLKADILADEKNLSEQQKEVNRKQEEVRDARQQVELKKRRVDFVTESLAAATTEVEQFGLRFEELNEKEQSISIKISESKVSLAEKEKLFSEAAAKKSAQDEKWQSVNKDLTESESLLTSLQEKLKAAEQKLAVLQSRQESSHNLLFSLEEELQMHQSENADVQKKYDETVKLLNSMSKNLEELDKKLLTAQSEKEKLKEELISSDKEMDSISLSINSIEKEILLLQNLIDQMEGFPESVKYLSRQKDWNKDVVLLSDIIDVDEKARLAVENYLGGYLNYFVVKTRQQALDAIKLLYSSQNGKAGFFILDDVPKTKASEQGASLLNYVSVEATYQKLIDYLLAGVSTGNLDEENNPDGDWVSLDGRITKKDCIIDGGSVGLFEGGKLGRKQRIEKLEKEKKKQKSELDKIEKKKIKLVGQLESINTAELESQIADLKKDIDRQNQSKVTWEVMIANANNTKSALEQKQKEAKSQSSQVKEEIASNEKEVETLKKQWSSQKSQVDKLLLEKEKLSDVRSDQNENYNRLHVETIQAKNVLENFTSQLQFLLSSKGEVEGANEETRRKIKDWTTEKESLLETIARDEERIKTLDATSHETAKQLNHVEKVYFGKKGDINKIESEYRQMEKSRAQTYELLSTIDRKMSELEVERNRIKDRLSVEFETSIDDILATEESDELTATAVADLESKVTKAKERILTFGPINLMALEAYEEMNERFETIISQRDDVIQAKESLMQTITEIEDTATRLYLDSFEKIKVNFQRVFRSLFSPEDDCDLVMLDPEDPLSSKIEIIAKPKGKKPKAISQLSGGEKTLTSIALLFSLYLIKPAPFCVFDEIDAPLDDVNVEKFNNIIREFSQESQFIIITHNKLTMADVDVIYGVYMDEPGVSGVAAVQFAEL